MPGSHSEIPAFEGHGIRRSPKPMSDALRARNRRHTVKKALRYFDDGAPRVPGRAEARRKVEAAPRPMSEAKRLVDLLCRQAVSVEGEIDFSDTQELRARLIRRDLMLDTLQADYINRMDRLIATGKMTAAVFERMAATVVGMEPAIPRHIREAWAAR